MPYRAKHHFYNRTQYVVDKERGCVNALSGQTSFLLVLKKKQLQIMQVSMPYRAKHHFYPDL